MINNYMTSNYLSNEILNSINIKENELIKSGIKRDIHFKGNQSNSKSSGFFNKNVSGQRIFTIQNMVKQVLKFLNKTSYLKILKISMWTNV